MNLLIFHLHPVHKNAMQIFINYHRLTSSFSCYISWLILLLVLQSRDDEITLKLTHYQYASEVFARKNRP
jgi:hypothetical protein